MTALLLLGGGALLLTTLGWAGGGASDESVSLTVPHVSEIDPALSLPVEMNDQVEGWMERFLTDQRPLFVRYLAREGRYADMIREKLRSRGMPEDLLYLALIESGFSPRATSRVAASGMWQFMSATAQAYGLRVDEYVDERRDPIRATDAALDFLQELHDQFGSWYLAAAAYNAGPARVARLVRQHAGEEGDRELYWDIVDQLPAETREYVPKFLAASLLAGEASRYGIHVDPAPPYRFERVWVPGSTSLSRVARAIGVPLSQLQDLNPHLIRGITPPGISYAIRVPPGNAQKLVASLGGRWHRVAVDD